MMANRSSWHWPKLALNWEVRKKYYSVWFCFFFFSGLQWIKKYLLPLHSCDKQVKAGRNEERIPYGNGISVLHTFWNLVHGDMLAFDLKALNVSGHCRNSRYKWTEFADVAVLWTVCPSELCDLKQHSQINNLSFVFFKSLPCKCVRVEDVADS